MVGFLDSSCEERELHGDRPARLVVAVMMGGKQMLWDESGENNSN